MSEPLDGKKKRNVSGWALALALLAACVAGVIIALLAAGPKEPSQAERQYDLEARAVSGEISGAVTANGEYPTVSLTDDGQAIEVSTSENTSSVPLIPGVTLHLAADKDWKTLCIATIASGKKVYVLTNPGEYSEQPTVDVPEGKGLCDTAKFPNTVIFTTPTGS